MNRFNSTFKVRPGKPMERAPLGGCRRPIKRSRMKPYRAAATGTIKDLERTLDELTRQVLRADERVSFTSGRRGTAEDPLQVSHLFGRSFRPTRWDVHPEGNCHLQLKSENAAHNEDKSVYQDEYIRRFGQEAFDDLDRRAHSNTVFQFTDLLKMITQRESMLL